MESLKKWFAITFLIFVTLGTVPSGISLKDNISVCIGTFTAVLAIIIFFQNSEKPNQNKETHLNTINKNESTINTKYIKEETQSKHESTVIMKNSIVPTNESPDEYIECENLIQRVDGKSITDKEIPYLIQLGYEKTLNRENKLIDLSEQEKRFFDELNEALSEINRTITMERLSNGVISVYSNRYYVGKIRLTGRKHWMQILRGETQIKTIDGELDDFIQHIPDWVRYIRLHCK